MRHVGSAIVVNRFLQSVSVDCCKFANFGSKLGALKNEPTDYGQNCIGIIFILGVDANR